MFAAAINKYPMLASYPRPPQSRPSVCCCFCCSTACLYHYTAGALWRRGLRCLYIARAPAYPPVDATPRHAHKSSPQPLGGGSRRPRRIGRPRGPLRRVRRPLRSRPRPTSVLAAADAALAARSPPRRGSGGAGLGRVVLEDAIQQVQTRAGAEFLPDRLDQLVRRLDHPGALRPRQVREGAAALAGVPVDGGGGWWWWW